MIPIKKINRFLFDFPKILLVLRENQTKILFKNDWNKQLSYIKILKGDVLEKN